MSASGSSTSSLCLYLPTEHRWSVVLVARVVLALEELSQSLQQGVRFGFGGTVEDVLQLVWVLVQVVELVERSVLGKVVVFANVCELGQQQVLCRVESE